MKATTAILALAIGLGAGTTGCGKDGGETKRRSAAKPKPTMPPPGPSDPSDPCHKYVDLMVRCRKFKNPQRYRTVGLMLCRGRSEHARVARLCAPKVNDCAQLTACMEREASRGAETRIERILRSMGPFAAALGCKTIFIEKQPKVRAVCVKVAKGLVKKLEAGRHKHKAKACGQARRLDKLLKLGLEQALANACD